jgi:glutamate-1-semialdehyde 2,1-aminomutase
VAEAEGAHFRDVDGIEYVDFLPGRHRGDDRAPRSAPTVRTVREEVGRGHHDAPTEDSIVVGEELRRRFGLRRRAVHLLPPPTPTGTSSVTPAT